MRKFSVAVVLMLMASLGYGQFGGIIDFDKKTWGQIKSDKLYVVFEEAGSSEYDKALKQAMGAKWDFSEVEFINNDEFKELQTDVSKFFLISVEVDVQKTNRTPEEYSYLYLVKGNKRGAKKGNINDFHKMALIQVNNAAPEVFIPVIIKNLNRSANLVMDGKLSSIGQGAKMIKSNTGKIKSKKLYLLKSELNAQVSSVADIKKDYAGEVVVVSKEELAKLIFAGEDINVFFTSRSSTKSWVHIYNAQSGEELYAAFNLITKKWPAGIIPYHSKKWGK